MHNRLGWKKIDYFLEKKQATTLTSLAKPNSFEK